MKILRNPQIRRNIIISLILTVFFAIVGFCISEKAGLCCIAACACFALLHLVSDWYRYRDIRELGESLDKILHGDDDICISDFEEGELAVLRSETAKLVIRLREQRTNLIKDKAYLADSMADISHQIRTPLTSINIITGMLQKPELTENDRIALTHRLSEMLSRIDWLISALLKISRLDAGAVKLKKEKIMVKDLVSAAAQPLLIPMDLREINFHSDCGEAVYEGDLEWSTEALSNILKNCMESTPSEGEITVKAQENPLFTEIKVSDTGKGIDKKDLPHLFERFYKGQGSSKNSVGIGLALCRMIISRQNGSIKAENAEGGGAVFTIRFYKNIAI